MGCAHVHCPDPTGYAATHDLMPCPGFVVCGELRWAGPWLAVGLRVAISGGRWPEGKFAPSKSSKRSCVLGPKSPLNRARSANRIPPRHRLRGEPTRELNALRRRCSFCRASAACVRPCFASYAASAVLFPPTISRSRTVVQHCGQTLDDPLRCLPSFPVHSFFFSKSAGAPWATHTGRSLGRTEPSPKFDRTQSEFGRTQLDFGLSRLHRPPGDGSLFTDGVAGLRRHFAARGRFLELRAPPCLLMGRTGRPTCLTVSPVRDTSLARSVAGADCRHPRRGLAPGS